MITPTHLKEFSSGFLLETPYCCVFGGDNRGSLLNKRLFKDEFIPNAELRANSIRLIFLSS
jgi:hypothetical protein